MPKPFSVLNNLPSFDFDDQRNPGIRTDVPFATDVSNVQFATTFDVVNTINITEVIRPDVADVRYEIDTTDTGILNVDWTPLPVGTTVTQTGARHTISGIDDAATWELIKNPTIRVPANYEGNNFYGASIIYNTNDETDKRITWEVGEYRPTALIEAEFDATADNDRIRTSSALLEVASNLTAGGIVTILIDPAVGEFNIDVNYTRIRDFTSSISSTVDILATPEPSVTLSARAARSYSLYGNAELQFDNVMQFVGGSGTINLLNSNQTVLKSWASTDLDIELIDNNTIIIDNIQDHAPTFGTEYYFTIDNDMLEFNTSEGYASYSGLDFNNALAFTQARAFSIMPLGGGGNNELTVANSTDYAVGGQFTQQFDVALVRVNNLDQETSNTLTLSGYGPFEIIGLETFVDEVAIGVEDSTGTEVRRYSINTSGVLVDESDSVSVTDDAFGSGAFGQRITSYGTDPSTGKYFISAPRYKIDDGAGGTESFGKIYVVNSVNLTGLTELTVTQSNYDSLPITNSNGPVSYGGVIRVNDDWIASVNHFYEEVSGEAAGCIQVWQNNGTTYPEEHLFKMSDFITTPVGGFGPGEGRIENYDIIFELDGDKIIVLFRYDADDNRIYIFDINNPTAQPTEVTGVKGGGRIYNSEYFNPPSVYETTNWTVIDDFPEAEPNLTYGGQNVIYDINDNYALGSHGYYKRN